MVDKKNAVVAPAVDDEPVYDAKFFEDMQAHLEEEEGVDDNEQN